jgi:uncharacterized OB-fold protein
MAIYRDHSKLSQPLMSYSTDDLTKKEEKTELSWTCPHCGHQTMIPTGTCYQCTYCGESTSC